jgi:hypothetical protein
LLRGSRDFDSVQQYRLFIADVVVRANGRVAKAVAIERPCLAPLPARRTSEYEEVDARVTKFALFTVRRVLYSAPSRLIGHRLKVRVFEDRIAAYLGNVCVLEALRPSVDLGRRGRVIDYRHLLPALKRKPGALVRWRLRDALFPRTEYAQTWTHLMEQLPEARAARIMVGLLDLAASHGCEVALAQQLAILLQNGEVPDLDELRARFAPRAALMPSVRVQLPSLAAYDELVEAL